MASRNLTGPRHPPVNGLSARKLVIFLHGLGADGNDLIDLAPLWAEQMPDTEFVSPHAPYQYDMAPQGRQWFSIKEYTPKEMLAGVRGAAPILLDFIGKELQRTGLTPGKLALVGFSQGTMMGLFVALHHLTPLAGVLGYSGRMIEADTEENEVKSRPPILLVHGDSDDLLPPSAMLEPTQCLASLEDPAQWHICSNLARLLHWGRLKAYITASERNSAISFPSRPSSSISTSLVCSPRRGGGRR